MCEFASFAILFDGTIRAGDLKSHWGIEKGWGLEPGSYREAEWTNDDDGKSLAVRVSKEDIQEEKNESWWKSLILAKHPNRQNLLNSIPIGKSNRDVFCFKNGKFHKKDGPAVKRENGYKAWWLNGKRHRKNGPAIDCKSGTKMWFLNGELHRENGPAAEWCYGKKEWAINGQWHRENGPAIEDYNSDKQWFLNGKRHREDGPAIEYHWGHKEWWLNGERLTEQFFIAKTRRTSS